MNLRTIIYVLIAGIISFLLISFEDIKQVKEPQEVYRVYLKGKSIGLIKNKESLENYIDQKQNHIKKKYNVDKVYAPDDLDITKEVTYNEKITSIKDIYKKIEHISPFTINGYTITIKGITKSNNEGQTTKTKDVNIYVLDKNVFKDAVTKTVQSFITKEKYDDYEQNTQKEIKDTGSIIENLYIKNKISIKENKVPVDKEIYQTSEDVSKILLFGTTEEQQKYTVKSGDTIEDVAFNNKISTEEFLIANTDFKDKNSLLFEGEQVTIGILHPQFDLIEEDHIVKDEEVNYETEVKYDPSKSRNYSAVEQAGVKGKKRVTQKIQKVNGETTNVVTVSTEELSSPIKEIVVKGGRDQSSLPENVPGYGQVIATRGQWGWPASCATVSSGFGYRWGSLHDGMDISGCGYGSNIFAAQSGTVVAAGPGIFNGSGYAVLIDHHNGYFTMYAHMCKGCIRVSTGANVTKGQVIGGMGKTGNATGVHLHFSLWTGYPYRSGRALNPAGLY